MHILCEHLPIRAGGVHCAVTKSYLTERASCCSLSNSSLGPNGLSKEMPLLLLQPLLLLCSCSHWAPGQFIIRRSAPFKSIDPGRQRGLISHFDYRQRGWETENMTESQKQTDKETWSRQISRYRYGRDNYWFPASGRFT